MRVQYVLKPSEDLYEKGPIAWMFKPYYVSIRLKEEYARELLGRELDKHYMEQDGAVSNKQYKAMNFNSGLRSEMDEVIRALGIKDADRMWEEMEEACINVLESYLPKKEEDGD